MSSSPGPTRHGVSEGQALLQATLAKAALAKARPSSQESVDTAESTRPIGATDPNIFLQTGPAARPNTPETPTGAVVEDIQHNILPDLDMLVGITSPAMPEVETVTQPSAQPPASGVLPNNRPQSLSPAAPLANSQGQKVSAAVCLPDFPNLGGTPVSEPLETAAAGPTQARVGAAGPTVAPATAVNQHRTHVVEAIDTLQSVALKYGTTPAAIQRLNKMMNTDLISFQTIRIPFPGEVDHAPIRKPKKADATSKKVKNSEKKSSTGKKASAVPMLQLSRSVEFVPSSPMVAEGELDHEAGWTARRQKANDPAEPAPAPVVSGVFNDFAEQMQNFARDSDATNPEIQTKMKLCVDNVVKQGAAAEVLRTKLQVYYTTAVAQQTAAIDLARCLADYCDDFQTKKGSDDHTSAQLAKSAVVFHEFAALQREMNASVSHELSRIDDLIADFYATKASAKAYKTARSKASSARDTFLATAPDEKHLPLHKSRGVAAATARREAEVAQLQLVEVVGRVGTINHVGLVDSVQSISGAVLKCALQTARVSIEDDKALLNATQVDASQALHNVRETLQATDVELVSVHKRDLASLDSGTTVKMPMEVIQEAQKRAEASESKLVAPPTCTFDSAFSTGADLVGDGLSDAEYLAQLANESKPDGGAIMMSARRGTLLNRERVLAMWMWRPAYFECHGFTLRKVNSKGQSIEVAKDVRNCKVSAASELDGSRPFVFQLNLADNTQLLLQTQSAREFAEWFTTLEQMTQGVPAETH